MVNSKLVQIRHVALIMDGNRRWARKNSLPLFAGHKKGEERIEPIVDTAIEMGISHLTFWAFSTENWHRDKKEVDFLMNLYRFNLDKKVDSFHKKKVKINVIGNLRLFSEDIQEKTRKWMEKTRDNKKITVNIALSYGGRDEIIRGIKKLANHLINKSRPKADRPLDETYIHRLNEQFNNITIKEYNNYLDTAGQPDPDLIIRTGGEQRLSGFLLWQSEYSELYFTEKYWPEFTPLEFKKAITEYESRQRRFGK